MNDIAPKTATSGGPPRSGAPASPPAPPAPPPSGDDDTILTKDEVFALLRIPEGERTDEALKNVPTAWVGGVQRYVKGQVITWLALGGDKQRTRRMTRSGA